MEMRQATTEQLLHLCEADHGPAHVELQRRQLTGEVGRVWSAPRIGPIDDGITPVIINSEPARVTIRYGRAGDIRVDPEQLGWWMTSMATAAATAIASAVEDDLSVEEAKAIEDTFTEDFDVTARHEGDYLFHITLMPPEQKSWTIGVVQCLSIITVLRKTALGVGLKPADLGISDETWATITSLSDPG